MAENDPELLNAVYKEISEKLGMDTAMEIYRMFKGQQISFPMRFFNPARIQKCILQEYNGTNLKTLAIKYGYGITRKPIYPEYLSQMLTKLQDRCGLPRCRFHDLRHLCASIMLLQGVNVKVTQERLGHKDITTTMTIYSHVLPSSAREAADKIGQLVYFSDAG